MEGILSQEEINRSLDVTFNDEQEIENQKLHKEMQEAEYKKANVSKNVTTNESAKSKFGTNKNGVEITALNPKGVHKPNVAPDGTIREVNEDVKFTNKIMENAIAGKPTEYPKAYAENIQKQNPGMFESIESGNKKNVLLRPTDEFFATTNIDRTGDFVDKSTKGRITALFEENGLIDKEAEERVKKRTEDTNSKLESDAKFEQAKNKRRSEIEADEIRKQENINAKVAKNKELIEGYKYYEAYKNGNLDSKGNIISETVTKEKTLSSRDEKMYQDMFDNTDKIKKVSNVGTNSEGVKTETPNLNQGAEGAEGTKTGAEQPKYSSKMDEIISKTKFDDAMQPEATMKSSGVFSDDASKYNLKNIAEAELEVNKIAAETNAEQLNNTTIKQGVISKIKDAVGLNGGNEVDVIKKDYEVKSDVFKDGVLKGNYGELAEGDSPTKLGELPNIAKSLKEAKEAVIKEMYDPATKGSNVYFEKGLMGRLDDMNIRAGEHTKNASELISGMGIDKDTKISWNKTESGDLEGHYTRKWMRPDADDVTKNVEVSESHKLRVNFGKDGSISGFNAEKMVNGEWTDNNSKFDLGNGREVGIERAKEIAKMNEKQLRTELIKENKAKIAEGVEGTKRIGNIDKIKAKMGFGSLAEEAKTILENAKTAVKSHTEATEVMAKNIGGILGDAGRVDLKAISAAASGAVEGASKEAGKNIHAGGNNTGKGMKSLLVLAGVGMAFGAVKATFDNSAEQRRQKQLELMAMRQQYGGAM